VLVDVQFNATKLTWPQLRDGAGAAESAGYGAVWVFDHLAGMALGGTSSFEAFTLLGALAASTTSIPLGSLVLNVFNRQPAVLAVGAASVTAVAGRQVLVGIGAGPPPTSRWAAELHAVGQPIEASLPRRHARVEQVIDVCERMWSPARDVDLATFPLPRPRPALHVGTNSTALATIAGRRADGIDVAWTHPRRDELFTAARRAHVAAGREPGTFTTTTWARWDDALLDSDNPTRRQMATAGVDRLILVVPSTLDAASLATTVLR